MGVCFLHCAVRRLLLLPLQAVGAIHLSDFTIVLVFLRGAFYPGTGAAEEVGYGAGAGYSVNVAWDGANMSNGDYLAAFNQIIVPIAKEFAPDQIIISAGFDAAEGDPIGGCCLTPECYAHMTALLIRIAPSIILLEGGYNLVSTAVSTEACLRVLLGELPPPLPGAYHCSPAGWIAIQAAKKAQRRYWSCLAGSLPPLAQATISQQSGQDAEWGSLHVGHSSLRLRLARAASMNGSVGRVSLHHGHRQHKGLSRKRQMLQRIHAQALKVFWRRRRKLARQQAAAAAAATETADVA